jgi:hypothetical protein
MPVKIVWLAFSLFWSFSGHGMALHFAEGRRLAWQMS